MRLLFGCKYAGVTVFYVNDCDSEPLLVCPHWLVLRLHGGRACVVVLGGVVGCLSAGIEGILGPGSQFCGGRIAVLGLLLVGGVGLFV